MTIKGLFSDSAVRTRVIAGLVAALTIMVTSWFSGATLDTFIAGLMPGLELSSRTGGSPIAASAILVGFGTLSWAWWTLRHRGLSASQWIGILAIWAAPLLAAAPLQSRDMYSYAAQGQLFLEGLSPYAHGVRDSASHWVQYTSPNWLSTPAPYGPLWMALARAIAAMSGGHIIVALLAFRLVAVGALVAIAWALPRLASHLAMTETQTSRAVWLGVANPFVITQVVGGGHNDALHMALIVVAVLFAIRGKLTYASFLVAAASMVKVTAFVALPFIAVFWLVATGPVTFKRLIGAGARTLGLFLLPVIAVSLLTGLGISWLNPTGGIARGLTASFTSAVGIAFGAIGALLGAHGRLQMDILGAVQVLGLATIVVALIVSFLALVRRLLLQSGVDGEGIRRLFRVGDTIPRSHGQNLPREATFTDIMTGLMVVSLVIVVLSPSVQLWYALWFLPFLALTARSWVTIRTCGFGLILALYLATPDGPSTGGNPSEASYWVGFVIIVVVGVYGFVELSRRWLVWVRTFGAGEPNLSTAQLTSPNRETTTWERNSLPPATKPAPGPSKLRD